MFDIDTLTISMNYEPVSTGNQTNDNAGTKANIDAGQAGKKTVLGPQYVLLPCLTSDSQGLKSSEYEVADDAGQNNVVLDPAKAGEATNTNSTNRLNTVSSSINVVSSSFTIVDPGRERAQRNEFESVFGQYKDANGNSIYRMVTPVSAAGSSYDNLSCSIPVTGIFNGAYDDEVESEVANFNNMELTTVVSPIPKTRIHKDHPKEQIIGDPLSAPQTRRMTKSSQEHAMMDVKSAFLYGTIEEEVYVCQPPGFEDPQFPDKVYKVYVDDIIFGSTKKSLCTEFEGLMHKKFHMSSMREPIFFLGLQVMQRDDEIFISQDKYVADILKKFDFSLVKTASTPIETNKALLKDKEAEDRIFRYLKGQPKLRIWYPRDSPFDLEAFLDNDYAGTSLDRKSTIGGCQFHGKRLISWQCKKQTVVANSTTEVEYVVAANCCGRVLWIQNQMLDYGFNFMNTKIYIDNESIICIVKNPVYRSKTKHIEIRHYFIRDSYEKRLIQEVEIPQSNFPTQTLVADKAAFTGVNVVHGRAATTVSSIDAGHGSVLCPQLSNKVESLQTELKQTKQTYCAAFTKLIKKVKKLEHIVNTSQARRRTKIIAFDGEEDLVAEDPSKQGRSMIEEIDLDARISLVPLYEG
ncbi:putative ribonuclease H-like domain-containing protein [Tanacetum coccineum]